MASLINEVKEKALGTAPTGQHLAAILPSNGAPLEVVHRTTPTPGPNELLIEVKSIAVNPIDFYQRAFGFAIAAYPAIPGSDVAGTVVAAGSAVGADSPKIGDRVTAFAPCFFYQGAPDYGAFQKYVLVQAVAAAVLPEKYSFNEGCLIPMAVETTFAGWYSIGLSRTTSLSPSDKMGMLVWGGASSVGSAAIQIARIMGFKVYSTSSPKHHAYLKELGASETFDYKDPEVVSNIVAAAKKDGLTFDYGYDAVGQQKDCMVILRQLKGSAAKTAMLVSAPRVPNDLEAVDGVEVKFAAASAKEDERLDWFHYAFNVWLKEKLASGEFVPCPRLKVIDGGLESMNKALDAWKEGVSGYKIVVEV